MLKIKQPFQNHRIFTSLYLLSLEYYCLHDNFDKYQNILVIDIDGNNLRQLTRLGEGRWASNPAWSPDGQWIAYAFRRIVRVPGPGERLRVDEVFGDSAIHLVKATGELDEPIEVADELSLDLYPAWVPEAFLSVSPSTEKQTTLWGRLKRVD